MAHNKLYRNFIILQEDEKNNVASGEKALSGYAKIEAKNDKCKISFYAQNLKAEEKYSIVLICYKKDFKQIVDLGSLNIKDGGKGEISKEYYVNNIGGIDISCEKISGAAVCKHKDGKFDYLMYGFMNGEHVKDDWKKCKVIKHKGTEDVDKIIKEDQNEEKKVCKEPKLEIKVQKSDESSKKSEKKEEKKEEKIKEKQEEKCKEKHIEEKKEEKYKEEKHKEKHEEKCKEKKEDQEQKINKKYIEENLDNKEEKEFNKKCPSCTKQDKNNESKHKEKYSLKDCEDYCSDRSSIISNFDEYETMIEREKEIDPYDFELRGDIGNFFKDVVNGFQEVNNKFKEIKFCKWYKVKVNSLDDMCDISNYNKYTVVYYPMINYYPYIKKYGYFMLGYKCDNKGQIKYLVYGVPGKKDKEEQPFIGKTGFVTWMKNGDKDNGLWLMFYDYKQSTVVVPMK